MISQLAMLIPCCLVSPNVDGLDVSNVADQWRAFEQERRAIDTRIERTVYESILVDHPRDAEDREWSVFVTRHLHWISDGPRARLERTFVPPDDGRAYRHIAISDGAGIYRRLEGYGGGLISGGTRVRIGDSGFDAFNQTTGFWFPGGAGPTESLSAALERNETVRLEPTERGGILRYESTHKNRPIHFEIVFENEPEWRLTEWSWTIPVTRFEHTGMPFRARRVIRNRDWQDYGSLHLPRRAVSMLYFIDDSPDGAYGMRAVRTDYTRLDASSALPGKLPDIEVAGDVPDADVDAGLDIDALFEPRFTEGDWVLDTRIDSAFVPGGHDVMLDGALYESAEPIHIADPTNALDELRRLDLRESDIALIAADTAPSEANRRSAPILFGGLASLLSLVLLAGTRGLIAFTRQQRGTAAAAATAAGRSSSSSDDV